MSGITEQPATAIAGWVFDLQRFSVHDGPGIRTTVFLKGCPLRCRWCHNPEGLAAEPQIRLSRALCGLCGRCAQVCPHGCHGISETGHTFTPAHCARCGACAEACPAGALELVGTRMTVDEVMAVVERDEPFYRNSGGGLTLSGGEPLAQFPFTRALLAAGKQRGYHTAVETSAQTAWEHLAELRPLVDLWLVDLKHTDSARHRALTGIGNEIILANIRRMVTEGWPVHLRVPWVPQHNAEESFLQGLLDLLTEFPTPPPVEFMPYHRLGIGKWDGLGLCSPISPEVPDAGKEEVTCWEERLRAAGFRATVY